MKYFPIYFLTIVLSISALGQNLEQKLIASAGGEGNHSNGNQYSFSIGEPVVELGMNDSTIISQGFQQWFNSLELSYNVINTSCPEASDGSISFFNIAGCTLPYFITVNGQTFNDSTLNGLAAGTYDILFSSSSCSKEIEIIVEEGAGNCNLVFYNGFTPNEDGTNDFWIIENITAEEFLQNEVEIYNRLGVLIWKGKNYDNSTVVFSGIDQNGNILPDATYFYFVKTDNQEFSGFIELLR